MADQVKDPYKQIWESRDLKGLESAPLELDNKTPEWQRGLGSFVDEMQGTGYGLAALGAQGLQNLVGPSETLKGVTDWGLEGYNRNMAESQSGLQAPSVARIEDIKNASDAMDWASYQLGKGLPMLGSLALSGGIGGALGRLGVKEGVGALAKSAVGDVVKKSVVTKGLQAAEGQVVTKAMQQAAAQVVRDSVTRGAMAGGFAGSFGLEGGQAFGEQVQGGATPEDAVKSAIAVGGLNGVLELFTPYAIAKNIGLGEHAKRGIADVIFSDEALSKKAVELAKEVGRRAGKGAAEGIATEGITEGLQELVSIAGERWAKNDPLFADLTKGDWSRIGNATAGGALVGGVAGGAGATVVRSQGKEQGQPAPGVQPPAASETQAAPKVQTPSLEQTRTQVLSAMLERANTDIQKAAEKGDTARVEELAKAKQIYEEELAKQQEVPVQPVVEQPPEQVQEQPLVEHPPVEQASVEQPSVESPPQETPPQSEAQPTSPNDTIQLKQGETVVLSPDGQTRVVPTAEQTANLNRLMGERPSKETPPTQPTEVQDGQAQAQTEALLGQTQPAEQWDKADLATRAQWIKDTGASTDFATRKAAEWTTWDKVPPNTFQQRLPKVINPQEGGDTKYSMPLALPAAQVNQPQVFYRGTVPGETRRIAEPFSAAKGKLFVARKESSASNYGKQIERIEVKPTAKILKEEDAEFWRLIGRRRPPNGFIGSALRKGESLIDVVNAIIQKAEKAGYDILSFASDADIGTIILNEDIIQRRENQTNTNARYSIPLTQNVEVGEATMEEFEAIRKQFQERQKQETPFKNWFGKGVKGITANEDGTPITLYHGTNNPEFNQWDSSRAGENSNHPTSGLGFFMTADQGSAARYGSNLMAVHAKIDNPYTLTDADLTSIETKDDAAKLRKKLMDQGYDGAVVTAPGGKPYVIAFESKQVKFVGNENPTDSPDFRYSSTLQQDKLPSFYSALERATQEFKQQKAPSVQWESMLSNMVKKGLIKQEELDWSGTQNWLKEQKGPITKEALLQHIRDNTLEVQETSLNDSPDFSKFGKWVSAKNSGPFGKHETLSWYWDGESNPSVTLIKAKGDTWHTSLSGEVGTLDEVKQDAEDYLKLYARDKFKARNTKWTEPGAENQHELVLTIPSIEPFNIEDTTHYGDVSGGRTVAWVRFNDRVDMNGKKTLFLEEVQSNRHQEGKKEGYKQENPDIKLFSELSTQLAQEQEVLNKFLAEKGDPLAILDKLDRFPEHGFDAEKQTIANEYTEVSNFMKQQHAKIAEIKQKIRDIQYKYEGRNISPTTTGVPNAPFKQTIGGSNQTLSGWAGLAFKRMLRYAAENGYDTIAWTTGEQQAKRYNLGNTVSEISYDGGLFQARNREGELAVSEYKSPEEVKSLVGEEVFRILANTPSENGVNILKFPADTVIGGEGMKGFYDRLLPAEINKYIKKWGARVDKTQLKLGDKSASVHSIEITPTMKDSVMQGQPLFSKQSEEQASNTGTTVENLRTNIDSTMGNGWLQQAESAGLVQVIDGAGPNGEAGSYDGNVVRLYTKTMPKNGSPIGVLLHEGGHTAAFRDVLGDSINGYLADIDTIARNGNKTAQSAITHATIATADVLKIPHNLTENSSVEDLKNIQALIEQKSPGLFNEEKLAYFIQYASEAKSSPGFLRRLINQIKAWFAQTEFGKRLKEAGLGFEINESMAVEWAKASLQKSLADAKEMVKAQNKAINEARKMPASERVGRALEAETATDPYYSMGLNELRQTLWTDPTDYRQDLVNKPGLLQKFRANFIDYFADIEKKAKNVYDAYSLLRNKKSALIEQSRQEYLLPLRDLIANSPWSAKEVGDMLAARHIKMDRVNLNLAERASDEFVDDLLKVLTPAKKKELEKARKFVKNGKNLDGTDYTGAGFDPAGKPIEMSSSTKRKLMFDLMNKYAPLEVKNQNGEQDVRTKWERFKDGAAGYSDGGVTKGELRSVDDVLSLTNMDQAKFDRIANLFDAMNRRTLDILEAGGLITASEHARLLADKSAYAPLRRESYNTDSEIEQLFLRAGQGGSKQLGTRTGTAELSEPVMVLQNALAKLEAAAAAAERNQANQELYRTVKADTEAWKPWFTIVDKDKYVTHDENGFLQERNATALNKADITLILNGKKLVIRPNMHNQRAVGFVRAVNNLDVQELSGPMKVLGWFNQITRWVNVSASPAFLMKNAIMDPFTAAYNIQASEAAPYAAEIFGNYGNAFRALKKVFMDGNRDQTDPDVRAVERFENAGGRTSFVEGLRAMDDSWSSFDAQVARRQGNLKQLMAAKDKWIDGIENFNILFENVMRFSTFQTLMEKGTVSESRAARIAQDLTTNFSRRGYKTQALGVWWLFFNATVQGNYQVVRNLMSSKRVQAMAGGTIALALALDLLGRALAPDDWDRIPENDKERNIIVPIKVGGDFIKIPAPWVYNVLWRMGGMLGETLAGVKKPQDGLLDLAAMTATTFNPISGGTLAQTIAPTAADPFVQILENKNFAGNPLGPEGFPGAGKKANSEMIWNNTPKGYQSLARFVNEATGGSAAESGAIDLRPADYQVLGQFLTGSLGKFLSDTVFGARDLFTKEIEGPKDIPIIKQFISDPYDPVRVQKYHTNVAGVFGAHKLQQMYSKGADRDLVKLHEVMATRGKELAMYAQAQDVERQIKSLRTRLRVAENREDTARVKELKAKIEKVQEKFNEAYKKRVG